MLLPDGSVISAGDDNPNADDANPQMDTYEIYKPPYFFKGARPVITNSPPSAGYGTSIRVGTTNPDIARAALVAPGAATHAVDMGQRVVNLPVTRRTDGTGYDVRTPANATSRRRATYMVFLVDTRADPSSPLDRARDARATERRHRERRERPGARRDRAQPRGRGRRRARRRQRQRDVQRGRPGRRRHDVHARETTTGAAVTGRRDPGGAANQWILDPSADPEGEQSYTATLGRRAGRHPRPAGNALATSSWAWTTAAPRRATPSCRPSRRACPRRTTYDVHPATSPNVTFSEPVQSVARPRSWNLRPGDGGQASAAAVAATVSRTGTRPVRHRPDGEPRDGHEKPRHADRRRGRHPRPREQPARLVVYDLRRAAAHRDGPLARRERGGSAGRRT